MLLKLEHIYKDYVQDKLTVPVLKDICFQVERGEYVAIMGPSGSGKTTLMNIIGCLDVASSGVYQLNGTDLKDFDDRTMAQIRNRSIGFVFQTFNLLPKQTALDNVALPLLYSNVSKKSGWSGRKQRWNGSDWGIAWISDQRSYQEDRSSVWPSQEQSLPALIFCWQMSLRERWIRFRDGRSWNYFQN